MLNNIIRSSNTAFNIKFIPNSSQRQNNFRLSPERPVDSITRYLYILLSQTSVPTDDEYKKSKHTKVYIIDLPINHLTEIYLTIVYLVISY